MMTTVCLASVNALNLCWMYLSYSELLKCISVRFCIVFHMPVQTMKWSVPLSVVKVYSGGGGGVTTFCTVRECCYLQRLCWLVFWFSDCTSLFTQHACKESIVFTTTFCDVNNNWRLPDESNTVPFWFLYYITCMCVCVCVFAGFNRAIDTAE